MKDRLTALQARYPIKEVRGLGFLLGMELEQHASKLVSLCQEEGLLVNCTAERGIRFLPNLNTTREETDEAMEILEQALKKFFHRREVGSGDCGRG